MVNIMSIEITDAAAERITDLMEAEESAIALRVFVQGGGCSGFNYGFSFADEINEDDIVLRQGETATVVVDPMSMMYLDGATIDYVKNLYGEQFTISNPNATTTCGCGSSFAV